MLQNVLKYENNGFIGYALTSLNSSTSVSYTHLLDAIRGKDVETALGILLYNPRYASTLIEKLLKMCIRDRD